MSLYKDASLVMIPSAYSDGRLYSIRPVPEYGNEILTQPVDIATDFTTNSGGVIVDANTFQTFGGGLDGIKRDGFVVGKQYRIEIQGTTTSSGFTYGNGSGSGNEYGSGFGVSYFTALNQRLWIRQITAGTTDITTFSIKEVSNIGDFDFSRGSNLAATRVDVNGLIEKGRENLFLQSNQFDTTWTAVGTTLTSGQSGYDGTNDAWLLSKDSGQYRRISQDVSFSGVCTLSVYAKANTLSQITLRDGSTNARVRYDLSDGSLVDTAGTPITHSITSVGNGWYRCSVTMLNSVQAQIYVDWSQSNAGSIYIQDAQLEAGLVATDYIETGASTAQAGILEDMPRLDYSGSCPALLLEPQRTNLWTYSEPTSGAAPPIASVTGYSDINEFSSVGLHGGIILGGGETKYQYGGSVSASTIYSLSCYMKTADNAAPVLANGSGDSSGDFLFVVGGDARDASEIPVADYSITLVSNNIYKVEYTFTTLSSVSSSNTGIIKYSGNRNADLEITGFQLEAGSYPTSYIPTYGSSVTRSYDNSSLGGLQTSSILNGTKGTLLFEGIKKQDWYFSNFVITTDGSNTNRSLLIDNSGSVIRLRVWNASSSIDATIFTTSLSNGTFKYLIRWDNGNLAVFVNGASVGSATINAYSYTTINLKEGTFSNNLVNQVLTFPTALTDSECIALTTL